MFAIVDDAAYGNVKGEEKSVGVLKMKKTPKNDMGKHLKEAEGAQMVIIK